MMSQSPFGLGSLVGDLKKEDLQSSLYAGAPEAQPESLQMPEFGSQLNQPAASPSLMADKGVESSGTSMGQMGVAGIKAASTVLGKLMEAKAAREKGLRDRKAEAGKQVALSTQRALEAQQAGTSAPLASLIGSYRP